MEKAWLRITSPQQDAEPPGQDLLGWLLIPLEGPVNNTGITTADSQVGKGFILSEPMPWANEEKEDPYYV